MPNPTITGLDANPVYIENGAFVTLDADVTLRDAELDALASGGDYGGTTLTLARNGGADAADEFSGTGNLSLVNGNVQLSGSSVGSYNPASGQLIITFAYGVSTAQANEVARSITYRNTSEDPPASVAIGYVFSSGETGDTNATGSITVDITPVNDAPTLTATGASPTFTEDGASPASLFSGASVSTVEAGQSIDGLTLTVSGLADGADETLSIDGASVALVQGASVTTANGFGVAVTVDDDGITFVAITGTLTPAQAQTLINGLAYADASQDPTEGDVLFTLAEITDSGGTASGGQDTTALSLASTVTVQAVNDAPTVAKPIADQGATEDQAFSFAVPAGTFADVEDDALTLTATMQDGSALPGWLSFDGTTGTFAGTPPQDFNGPVAVRVTASDGALEVSEDFAFDVQAVNDAPTVAQPIADQGATEDQAFSFAVPAGTFADVEDDALTLTATMQDGSALPGWLSFDGTTGTFAGTPPQDFNGPVAVRVTASDGALEVSEDFAFDVQAVNDAPTVAQPIADQGATEDQAFSFAVPAGTFADVEDDALTLTATMQDGSALPGWLSFDGTTGTFAGTPPQDFNGPVAVRVTASDGALEVSEDFAFDVQAVNDAPTVAQPIADQGATEDQAFSFAVPAGTFADVEDDALTLTATMQDGSALPGWLSFDGTTGTFAGTPPQDFNGPVAVRVTASDGALEVSEDFAFDVQAVNDAPTVAQPIADQGATEDQAFSFAVPAGTFADVEDDALTLTATMQDGSALPGWLSFDGTTGTFAGTPPQDFNGPVAVRVTASDGALEVSEDFAFDVQAVNDAPTVANTAISVDGSTITTADANGGALSGASDVDGDALSVSAVLGDAGNVGAAIAGTYGTLILGADGAYSYVADGGAAAALKSGETGMESFTYTVSDGQGGETQATLIATVTGVNDAPFLVQAIGNRTSLEDNAVSFQVPESAFADIDGDALTLSASGLPDWLSFDAGSRTISGAPPQDFHGAVSITMTATDGEGASASDTFTLAITPVNDAPKVTRPLENRAFDEDSVVSFTLPTDAFVDVDNIGLALSAMMADESDLPQWLSFNASTGAFLRPTAARLQRHPRHHGDGDGRHGVHLGHLRPRRPGSERRPHRHVRQGRGRRHRVRRQPAGQRLRRGRRHPRGGHDRRRGLHRRSGPGDSGGHGDRGNLRLPQRSVGRWLQLRGQRGGGRPGDDGHHRQGCLRLHGHRRDGWFGGLHARRVGRGHHAARPEARAQADARAQARADAEARAGHRVRWGRQDRRHRGRRHDQGRRRRGRHPRRRRPRSAPRRHRP